MTQLNIHEGIDRAIELLTSIKNSITEDNREKFDLQMETTRKVNNIMCNFQAVGFEQQGALTYQITIKDFRNAGHVLPSGF
jgi:hypothetical protein